MINKKVLFIVPCYNEQGNISKVYDSLSNIVLPNVEITILLINDCSVDNTINEIRAKTNLYIDLPINLGIGGAVQVGYKFAKKNDFDIAVQFDGDGQHPANQISDLISPILSNKANVVIGSRFLNKKGFQSTLIRRIGISFFKKLIKTLTGLKITDATSGFRAIDKKVIDLVCDYYPDTYPEPETLILYHLSSFKIIEVPVVMSEREEGVSSIGKISSLYYMAKVTLGILFIYFRLRFNGKHTALQNSNT